MSLSFDLINPMKTATQKSAATEENLPWMEVVTQQVTSLRFGIVQIMVHDSKVVQVERTEKIRIAQTASSVHRGALGRR